MLSNAVAAGGNLVSGCREELLGTLCISMGEVDVPYVKVVGVERFYTNEFFERAGVPVDMPILFTDGDEGYLVGEETPPIAVYRTKPFAGLTAKDVMYAILYAVAIHYRVDRATRWIREEGMFIARGAAPFRKIAEALGLEVALPGEERRVPRREAGASVKRDEGRRIVVKTRRPELVRRFAALVEQIGDAEAELLLRALSRSDALAILLRLAAEA